MRFFFDYRSADQSLYDYQGHEFSTSEAAIEFGEALADNLRQSLGNEWVGWRVEVLAPDVRNFCSFTVGSRPNEIDADGTVADPKNEKVRLS